MNVISKSPRKKLKQQTVTFGAYQVEIDRWRKAAGETDRTLSWWIRKRVLTAEEKGLPLSVEPPPDLNAVQVPLSFGAFQHEIQRWEKAAKTLGSPRGAVIRSRLLQMDVLDHELAAQEKA